MSSIPGSVPITGFIAPSSSFDTYAVFTEEYGKGGFRTVNTLLERDQITNPRRKIGMLVKVVETGHYYELRNGITNLHWSDLGPWATSSNSNIEKIVRYINGNGTQNTYIINHGLGTKNVLVEIVENNSDEKTVYTDVKRISENEIEVSFGFILEIGDNYKVIIV